MSFWSEKFLFYVVLYGRLERWEWEAFNSFSQGREKKERECIPLFLPHHLYAQGAVGLCASPRWLKRDSAWGLQDPSSGCRRQKNHKKRHECLQTLFDWQKREFLNAKKTGEMRNTLSIVSWIGETGMEVNSTMHITCLPSLRSQHPLGKHCHRPSPRGFMFLADLMGSSTENSRWEVFLVLWKDNWFEMFSLF